MVIPLLVSDVEWHQESFCPILLMFVSRQLLTSSAPRILYLNPANLCKVFETVPRQTFLIRLKIWFSVRLTSLTLNRCKIRMQHKSIDAAK